MPTRHPYSYRTHIRRIVARKQGMRCFYCNCPMWLKKPHDFSSAHAINPELIELYRCTAEHLIPRYAGGKYNKKNIAAACFCCNQKRGRTIPAVEPISFTKLAQIKEALGEWHVAL